MSSVRPIVACLWFNDQAEEAARLYTGIFPNSRYWDRLSEGGDPEAQQCGWLKDRFGVSWQVTPRVLIDMLADPDPGRSRRTMEEVLKMKKVDIAALERVHAR